GSAGQQSPATSPFAIRQAAAVGTIIPNRVFVGGIPTVVSYQWMLGNRSLASLFQVGEEDIRKFFETFGAVRDAKIIKDPNGASRGYGNAYCRTYSYALQYVL